MTREAKLTVLGCRGSVPVSGAEYIRYGGATTCYRLRCEDCTVFLDAGTGMLRHSANDTEKSCHVLITHPHADHLYGLPMFAPLYSPDFQVSIWGIDRAGKNVREQLGCLMRPPLWPITSEAFRAKTSYYSFGPGDEFSLSPTVSAETLPVSHPGGCIAYKLKTCGKALVFATDTELDDSTFRELSAFAGGCDLLVLDAQYTDGEYTTHTGFGHSPLSRSLELIERAGAKSALLTHHDPFHTDKQLDALAGALPQNVRLAAEGMEVCL